MEEYSQAFANERTMILMSSYEVAEELNRLTDRIVSGEEMQRFVKRLDRYMNEAGRLIYVGRYVL